MIDNALCQHPKYLALTKPQRAELLDVWVWVDAQRTDGYLPGHVPKAIGVPPKSIERFCELGLLEPNGTGYYVHDWHDYNPPVDAEARKLWMSKRRQARFRNANRNADGALP